MKLLEGLQPNKLYTTFEATCNSFRICKDRCVRDAGKLISPSIVGGAISFPCYKRNNLGIDPSLGRSSPTALDASNTTSSLSLSTSIAPSRGVSPRNKSAPLLRRVKHFPSPFLLRGYSPCSPLGPWETTPTGDMLVHASLLMALRRPPPRPPYVQRNGREDGVCALSR